ncbi:mercury resistance protein [Providencia rettgeri]|uniref:Mercury resistance protein n=1 Tax=Providencia rettgeri TaxID=587 RepID=A0A939NDJ2_PRORE|nr:mercury resistance protein [Providencia rettgeri]
MQHTQQVVQLAVFGAFAFMVVLLRLVAKLKAALSAGWEAVMIFP